MDNLKYLTFDKVSAEDFLLLLNKLKLREHLIQHELFDLDSTCKWMHAKLEVDSSLGCKVRAIKNNDQLIGWCGIQREGNNYEIAIVIDDKSWGIGIKIFEEIMIWAKELAHDEVLIHFLHTRPKYKFLQKMAKEVYQSELFGNKFNTYKLEVK